MKTKALISCRVTVQVLCAFVFAYAKGRFSHDMAHIIRIFFPRQPVIRVQLKPVEAATGTTIKFLNFRSPEKIAVIYPKFKQRCQTLGNFIKKLHLREFHQKVANGLENSEDPDRTSLIWVCTVCPDVSV